MLYIVLFLHQTTTWQAYLSISLQLYIVLFLHQTTTTLFIDALNGKLYIVLFLHQTTTYVLGQKWGSLLYIVLFLHQTTTFMHSVWLVVSCISYYSYIKPQHITSFSRSQHSCISYYSYIKPQPSFRGCWLWVVVYRTIPTSNHNRIS